MAKGKKPAKVKKGLKGLARLEHQLLKEAEGRKKFLEEETYRIKTKAEQEKHISRVNSVKLDNQWREIMRVAKSKTIQNQIFVLKQTHERQLDRKDAIHRHLEKDVLESDAQYANALQAHLINLDTLIDLQYSRLTTLQRQFDCDLAMLEEEFNTEKGKLQSQHCKEKMDIIGIMTRLEQEFQEAEADAKHEYQSLRDDVKNKNLEEKHALRIQLEGAIEELWRQFQQALNNYNASTEERKAQFENLKQRDQNSAKIIEQQMKKLTKLQETISHLKTKLANNSREYEERNKALREEKEAIQHHFQELKRKMNLFREVEHKKLTELTVLSHKVLKQLKGKVVMAEKIIKLAEMNRKLETEEEKVLPFYKSDMSVQADATKDNGSTEEPSEAIPREVKVLSEYTERYNKTYFEKLALEKERSGLQDENNYLKYLLKQYLNGISVNAEVLENDNPLFVVNGKTNAPLTAPVHGHITCVEGVHTSAARV